MLSATVVTCELFYVVDNCRGCSKTLLMLSQTVVVSDLFYDVLNDVVIVSHANSMTLSSVLSISSMLSLVEKGLLSASLRELLIYKIAFIR